MKNWAGSAAAEGTESLYGRNKVVSHPECLPARCQGRAPCALRTGATQCTIVEVDFRELLYGGQESHVYRCRYHSDRGEPFNYD